VSTTIYTARVIRTANESQPTAQAVAVRDGKVLAVGSLEDCLSWGDATIDTRFENQVISAGFVEAHAHQMESMFAHIAYIGWFDRWRPDGTLARGTKSVDELITRLREIDATLEPGAPLLAAGLDPIYYGGERVNRHHLDEVSTSRPIMLMHQSGHLTTCNSVVVNKYDLNSMDAPGIGRDANGVANGELREPAAMALATDEWRAYVAMLSNPADIALFAQSMRNAGITTAADLANSLLRLPAMIERLSNVTKEDSFPVRVVAATHINTIGMQMQEVADKLCNLGTINHDKLHFPIVKLVLDGSIQGFTAMISWPGVFKGEDHGQFLVPPEQVIDLLRPFHRAGIGIHCHCNGDLTAGVFIDAIDQLLREHSWLDHRHTITHAQLVTNAQLRRAKNLGMCCNFFSNHVWTWGEQHRAITVGPDRADRIDPCATAERLGISFALHSDAPVTPPSQLHTMWAAVNRVMPNGKVLGPNERISVASAYKAVTIDAAYQMHMDHLVGSIEVGKFADFTILDMDPFEVDPMELRDINVWGTVVGGVIHPSNRG
jgi:hypothetical protein